MQKIILYVFAFSTLLFLSNCVLSKEIKVNKFYRKNATSVKKELFREEIGFELVDNLIILPVKIKNETYNFILNTGFTSSISKDLQHKLGYQNISDFDTTGTIVPKITIGKIDFTNTLSIIIPTDTFGCKVIHGCIGANLMQKAIWKIDYGKQKIIFTNYRDSLQKAEVQSIDFQTMPNGTPYSMLYFSPDQYSPVAFVTGERHAFCFSNGITEFLPSNQKYQKHYTYYGKKVNIDTAQYTLAPYMRFENGLIFKNLRTNFQQKNKGEYSGAIGYQFFKNYITTIDWSLKKITLQDAYKSNLYDERFGFYVYYHDKKVVISVIYKKMPAMEAGLHLTDEVLNMDNLNFENMTREQFCDSIVDIIKILEKDEITLKVKQKDIIKTVILKKKKIDF